MIMRNTIAMLIVGLLLSPLSGLAAEPPPHEALYHVFLESVKAQGILIHRNAGIANNGVEPSNTRRNIYVPIEGVVLIYNYADNELVKCVIEIDEHTYAFDHFPEILACFILSVDDLSTTYDEAQALETHLIETLSVPEFPATPTSHANRGYVQLKLSTFFLSESIKEDGSEKTMRLIQLTASF